MSRPSQGRRGRPLGMKLSQASKDQISKSKTGFVPSEESKQKTSRTLKRYFENNPKFKTYPKTIICRGCGIEFKNNKPIPRIYCDACKEKYRRNGEVGEYHKIYTRLKATKKYKQWRLEVLERDKFRCKFCGKVGQAVHHLVDMMKIKDIPELLYNPDIGVTLCHKCHGLLHAHIRTARAAESMLSTTPEPV